MQLRAFQPHIPLRVVLDKAVQELGRKADIGRDDARQSSQMSGLILEVIGPDKTRLRVEGHAQMGQKVGPAPGVQRGLIDSPHHLRPTP